MVLTIEQVIALKEAVKQNTGHAVHLHDACGGQYFSLDSANEQVKNFIIDYFAQKGAAAVFANDQKGFTVKENR